MATTMKALKQGQESKQTIKIDLHFTAADLKIVEQVAEHEKHTVEEFLADHLDASIEGHLDGGAIPGLLTDVWREIDHLTTALPKEKSGYERVIVPVILNEDKANILKLISDLSEKYDPDFFCDSVIESIRAHLEAECDCGSCISEEIASRLYEQWCKLHPRGS